MAQLRIVIAEPNFDRIIFRQRQQLGEVGFVDLSIAHSQQVRCDMFNRPVR